MAILNVESVTKSFGSKQLLNNISLQCETGKVMAIFGRNGCGKSTLLKILFGTVRPDTVIATVDGKIFDPKENIAGGTIGYLPQDSFLPKSMKVRDLVPLYCKDAEAQDKIFYYKGIDRLTNTKAGNLSLGELRYLEIIMTGHLDHSFLLLDEPFSMIEPLYKEMIKEFIDKLRLTKGIIATDHYYNDMLEVADYSYIIKDGATIPVNGVADLQRNGYLPG